MKRIEFEGIPLIELPGADGIFGGVYPIDADLAKRLLGYNTHNRKPRPRKTAELRRAFEGDEWKLNGEAFKFSCDDVMLDGQHRAEAIIEVGRGAYPTVVIWGLDPDSQQTMDQGLQRLAFEQLTLSGIDVDATISAAMRVIIRWSDDLLFSGTKVTTSNIVAWAQANPAGVARLREFKMRGYHRIIGCPPATSMAAAFRFDQIASETAAEFFDGLIEPLGLEKTSPIWALRQRLERISNTRQRVLEKDMLAYYVSSWNAYREGRTLLKMPGVKGGRWLPGTFPEPV